VADSEKYDHAVFIETYFDRLWPICRSITGDGLRNSFEILKEIIPLQLHEVKSGTEIFDWTVPDEWNIRDACIFTPAGEKIADFSTNNLHVVNYSMPVDRHITFEELEPHLYYKEDMPDAVPYITSYYKKRWGFCISYNTFLKLPRQGLYRVMIDSTLEKGSLTYGDLLLPGESEDEILFSSYLCHPSMANNELSGPLTLAFLYRELKKIENRRYSLRFVIAPETIGALCYLKHNRDDLLKNVKAGFIFTCCGDPGPVTYKCTRDETSMANRIVNHVLGHSGLDYNVIPFDPVGSDERQYASPGFNLPVGVMMRTPFSEFPQYHTSFDNKELMDFDKMAELVHTMVDIVKTAELNRTYENQIRYGEPFMGKRNLYEDLHSKRSHSDTIKLRMRLLNYLDGNSDLLSICDKYGYSMLEVSREVNLLLDNGLIK
jgi:aminopeptidase-like protein